MEQAGLVDNIKFVISALGGAFITGVFGLWLQKLKNNSSNEGIYASHFSENVDMINKLSKEGVDLRNKNAKLEMELTKVKNDLIQQRKVVDTLTKQVGVLQNNKGGFK